MFTEQDLLQIKEKGIPLVRIKEQLENFERGFPYADIVRPATPGNGIMVFGDEEIAELEKAWNISAKGKNIVKLVPASGAATRMFKHLFEFLGSYGEYKDTPLNDFRNKSFNSVYRFLADIEKFAFYDDLRSTLKSKGLEIGALLKERRYDTIIRHLLTVSGLNYGNMPKGLIKFHRYREFSRTSMGEHLVEGAHYATGRGNKAHCHFTVSPEHLEAFRELVEIVTPYYEENFGVQYKVSFSVQKPSTDMIAVDLANAPFRDEKNRLVFRPGGHGALIENLNDLKAEIIFIKNIDNVVPDHLKSDTYKYKKVIGGLLIQLTGWINDFLVKAEKNEVSGHDLESVMDLCTNELGWNMEAFSGLDKEARVEKLVRILHRPVRVCGMVKNEGEPGGGPFWVRNQRGEISLQVVETSQIDMSDGKQREMLSAATHFNPVDLVCSVKDHRGSHFNLLEFVDRSTGFISIKSRDGQELKAQELPGLWNGAMADWITVFVEVPISTFNPVKTVNDLLRPQHQPAW